ncbi:MAG: PASTA domain-containing protein [Solirubrobacterales bacterium]|nr:PASTA domain-containing protein [Solirubrobacterales bacterium]
MDQAPKKVTVPNAVGQTQSQGDKTLQNAGLDAVYATRVVTNRSQNGIVLAMSPGSGSKVLQGTNVALTIGKYNKPVPPVPPAPPGPSSIVKQWNLVADQTKTYTVTWGSGTCPGGKGNAVLQGNGGGSAMSGAQITAQGQPTDNAYYATTTTSDITSPVTLVITITCLVQ